MKKLFLVGIILFQINFGYALEVNVRIFSENKITELEVKVDSGKYQVVLDGVAKLTLNKAETVIIKTVHGKFQVKCGNSGVYKCENIKFQPADSSGNRFKIKPAGLKERIYDDGLTVYQENNAFTLINTVNLEKYIAGVIQSEAFGSTTDLEFFKIQAIISRTFAIANWNKHKKDRYNLCDGVHCQAYYSRCHVPDLCRAVSETCGEVIVDTSNKVIDASFHSNSGGQTANSEDVWVKPIAHLKSVTDTFSLSGRSAVWEKEIPKNEWLKYFGDLYGNKYINPPLKDSLLNFTQETRKKFIVQNIPLTAIRAHFKLRSAFFEVIEQEDTVLLKGKGYGHGVGLSQEGAINMVKQGWEHEDVLRFYYSNVKIVKYDQLENNPK